MDTFLLNILKWLSHRCRLWLTLVSLVIYIILVFERLPEYPIYFFCDEAILGVEAQSLLTTGADQAGTPWPIFFKGFGDYQQSLAIYLQIPFTLLFGLNEFSIRLMTSCISLIGVGAVYGIIQMIYKMDSAWMTFLIFALSPVWFLHSRAGFEVIIAVSFLLACAFFYLLTFTRHLLFVIPAAICGAATFYAYTPGRGWILLGLVVLFWVNIPEHVRHWKRMLIGILVFVALMLPYISFHRKYPDRAMKRLESLNFASVQAQPFWKQVKTLVKQYATGVNPAFWYTWGGTLHTGPMGERHVVPPLPQLFVWTFPFACIGILILLRHIRKIENRTLLSLWVVSPIPASLVGFNNVRGMPVGIFLLVFALIGVGWSLQRLRRWPRLKQITQFLLLGGLLVYTIIFRTHVYTVAPYKHQDYGFYGVQMGVSEVFHWIQEHHAHYAHIFLAYDLFNAGDIFLPFYLSEQEVRKTSIVELKRELCLSRNPLQDNTVYIVRKSLYSLLNATGCPIEVRHIDSIPDIKGDPLFDIVQLQRGPNFDEWFERAEKARRQLQTSIVQVNAQHLCIEHPVFDLGSPQFMFDGQETSLARTEKINPAHIVIHLPSISLQRIAVTISHNRQFRVSATTYIGDIQKNWGLEQRASQGGEARTVTFEQPERMTGVTAIEVTVLVLDADQYGYVHINEIFWE